MDRDLELMKQFRYAMALSRRKNGEEETNKGCRGLGHILELLSESEPKSQQKLAEEAKIRPQSVSEALAVLEKRGDIFRTEDPSDRRSIRILLTPQGARTAKRLWEERTERAHRFFAPLSVEEKETLSVFLQKITQSLE
jgi:DNA-binding MarR family transcriptional regulator